MNPHVASLLEQLHEGMLLYTTDGKELGRIREIRDGFIRIDATMARDYWLHASVVTDLEEGVGRVSFPERDLDRYRLKEPVPSTTGSPAEDERAETFGSQKAQDERRERMQHPGDATRNYSLAPGPFFSGS